MSWNFTPGHSSWTVGHSFRIYCPGVMGDVPMRTTLSPDCMAFRARITASLLSWMIRLASPYRDFPASVRDAP